MITPSFGLTSTDRVLPKLALDFTTASLDSRVTFTRTTGASNPATYVDSNGLIASASNNQPRFDYDPVALICKGLLIEESRTNNLTYSQDFSNLAWSRAQSFVTSETTTAPDGAANVDKLYCSVTPGSLERIINRSIYAYVGQTVTGSVFLKKKDFTWAQVNLFNGGSYANRVWFNLDTGAIGTNSSGIAVIVKAFPNGWYRVSLTATIQATGAAFFTACGLVDGDGINTTTVNDGVSGTYIWGAQLEAGAFATSYIPTTTTALTRNADVATITGTAFSGIWRSGPGSILVRALPSTVSGTRPLVQVDDNTADNIIALRGNATNPELYIRAGGSDQATIDAGTISAAAYRLAGAWQAGSAAASLNSGLAVNGAPASIPAVTQMRLGSDGTNYLNGHLQAVEYWPLRLSNASLQNASSTAGYQSIIHPVSRDTIITEPV